MLFLVPTRKCWVHLELNTLTKKKQAKITTSSWTIVLKRGEDMKMISKHLWTAGNCRYIAGIPTSGCTKCNIWNLLVAWEGNLSCQWIKSHVKGWNLISRIVCKSNGTPFLILVALYPFSHPSIHSKQRDHNILSWICNWHTMVNSIYLCPRKGSSYQHDLPFHSPLFDISAIYWHQERGWEESNPHTYWWKIDLILAA